MYETPVFVDGILYRSAENAFQAMKVDENEREIFVDISPKEARQLGKKVTLPENWEDVRLGYMTKVVSAKFENEYLKRKLLETGDRVLVEGNTWGDRYWGVYNGKGENNLGTILMELRDKFRQEKIIDVDHFQQL